MPIGPHGAPKQVYLVVFIDDATRFVVAGAFYPTLDQVTVEDSFHQGIQAYGRPDAVYFDSGKQYRSHQMSRICAKVGTRLLFARPYTPESKGKIEKFNQMVDDFLAEVAVAHPATLDRLNTLFSVWLMECYQTQPHSALPDGQTPTQAYQQDPQPPHWVDPDLLAQAFLHAERRKVDKVGCISFQGRKYEVGLTWIGKKVDVVYDPHDTETVTIECDGQKPWSAHPLVIGEWAGHRPALPDTLQPQPVAGSRLLEAAEQRHQARAVPPAPAVVYRTPPTPEEDAHGDH